LAVFSLFFCLIAFAAAVFAFAVAVAVAAGFEETVVIVNDLEMR